MTKSIVLIAVGVSLLGASQAQATSLDRLSLNQAQLAAHRFLNKDGREDSVYRCRRTSRVSFLCSYQAQIGHSTCFGEARTRMIRVRVLGYEVRDGKRYRRTQRIVRVNLGEPRCTAGFMGGDEDAIYAGGDID